MFRCILCAVHGRWIEGTNCKQQLKHKRFAWLPCFQHSFNPLFMVSTIFSIHIVPHIDSYDGFVLSWQLCDAWVNRGLSITVLTLIWQSATWYVRVSWTCCSCCGKQTWWSPEKRVWMSTYVLPWQRNVFPLLKKTFTPHQDTVYLSDKTIRSHKNLISYLAPLLRNKSKAALFAGTSNSLFSPGSLPRSGNEKVGSWCHWQTPSTECRAKVGGGRGGPR